MTTRTAGIEPALNEVDLPSVGALIEAVSAEPGKAHTTWSASVEWNGGFRSQASIRDFDPIPSDEPPGLGGTDTAPNPVEQLLAALGNCLAVGYAANLSAAGIPIESLRVDVEGDVDLHSFLGLRAGHAGFNGIRASVNIDTGSNDPGAVEALHRRVIATSPVGHTLSAAIPLDIQLT